MAKHPLAPSYNLDGPISDDVAYAILEEVQNALANPPPEFIDRKFPEQASFIRDKAIFKAAQCPRRAGKSRGVGLWLLEPIYREANITTLYLAKTRDSAKRIMWRDVLKEIDRDLKLELHPNESDLTLTNLTNGSILQLAGADSSPDQMKRYLGSKLRRCAIDESAEFQQDIEQLVYEILYPAMADHDGEIALIGSPGSMCKGLFYDVTERGRPGWSVHKWSSIDNPYMRDKIKKQIQKLEEDNPRIRETPWFRRNYLNEWVQESTNLCYKFQAGNNAISEVKNDERHRILNVLGIDLGFNDDTAFTVGSFSVHEKALNFIDCYKKQGMIISDVAERIAYYQKKYTPYAMVVDGASKQAVEELKQRFGFPLVTANKQGKAEFIEIMNSEFIGGKIKLLTPQMEPLIEEYAGLIWDPKAAKREEHPACANHLCFVAGTMIRTPKGLIPIEFLQVGDLVETRKGPRRIKHTINRTTAVIELTLTNGVKITCTPDHPFWSVDRWVAAKDLNSTHALLSWSQIARQSVLDSTTEFTDATQETDTSPDKRQAHHLKITSCIGNYGDTLKVIYPMDFTSITSTVTSRITGSRIWNACRRKITEQSMLKNIELEDKAKKASNCSLESVRSRLLGTDQKKAELGIESTQRHLSQKLKSWLKLNVRGVRRAIKSHAWLKAKSVVAQENALPQKGELQESITSKDLAPTVIKTSQYVNTSSKEPAHLSVRNITATTDQKTYNITVDDQHEYFANDILVSNCDAALYTWRHCFQYLSTPAPRKELTVEEKLDEWEEREAESIRDERDIPFWERN